MYEKELFKNLMNLCYDSEAFYFKDHVVDGQTYRIFSYRLVSWSEFQKVGALDCRGTMFNVSTPSEPILVSFPMPKFFNYEEGDVDHTKNTIDVIMPKLDGSLISTYLHNGSVRLKSKASLNSSQAIAAMNWLDARPELKDELARFLLLGNVTVNFEYTAPTNRVVVPYQEENLTIISIRFHDTGRDIFADEAYNMLNHAGWHRMAEICGAWVGKGSDVTHQELVDIIRQEQEGEGYVIALKSNCGNIKYRVKVKTHRYTTLHQAKDGAETPKRLFAAVIDEATDDLRSLFENDPYILNLIQVMENKVVPVYNHIVSSVEMFCEQNKELSRKDFAIKAKAEWPQLMGLIMAAYLGQQPNYKEFAKKNMTEIFGVSSDVTVKMSEE